MLFTVRSSAYLADGQIAPISCRVPLPLRPVARENCLKRADEIPVVALRAFRTFVPTVRDQDDICDFGANDRQVACECTIFVEVKGPDVRHGFLGRFSEGQQNSVTTII